MITPGLYEHYNGGFYRVLFIAKDSNNGVNNDKDVVVYVSLSAPGRLSVRHMDEFDATVQQEPDVLVKRFTRVGE
jgi:hypothetical protein